MKKITFTFIALLFSVLNWAQIITTNPTFVTQNGGAVEIVFDAAQGTAGLKDYVGTDGVFAHTGVITNLSTSNSDWKYAPTWGDNSAKYQCTSLGNNKWKFIITPSIKDYYGVSAGETVKKLAFVFRNGLKTKEGKDVGGVDIFVDVYASGLNVAFTNPSTDQSVTIGSIVNIQVGSSLAATALNLKVNGTIVKTANGATTLSHSYTFDQAIDYVLIAEAILGGQTVRDTIKVCVPAPVTNQARPTGMKTGINYVDNSTVTLVLYAPLKSNVFVIGEFNDWSQLNAYQLKKDGEYWWITLTGLTPAKMYGFQYLVDGTIKVSDPYAELVLDSNNDKWINEKYNIYPNLKAYPEGKTDGLVSVLQTAKPAYNWEIPNFTMPSHENMVIYELLLRDFTVEKSLEAAITKLDYLKTLGITAVELMPVQEFDGNNSWGYNPNHFFAPDKAYGSTETYKEFIDECHKRGIAVILDIVPNHASGSSPLAKMWWNGAANQTASDNPYFNVTAKHPYSVFHDFNHEYAPTREHFKRVVQHWLAEYKVDGFRLDLTKGLSQRQVTESNASTYDQSRIDILTDYYNAAKATKSHVMFILEHFCDYSEEIVLANKGMYLWRNVNNSYSQATMGYSTDSDFGGMNSSPRRWVGFAESHDEERNFFKVKTYGAGNLKTDSIARANRIPLKIAFSTLIPGPKMIWQFGELGYDYSIDSNGGRTSEKPSAWGYLNLAHRKAAYDASAKIITLRKLYPTAFTQGNFAFNIGIPDWTAGRRIALTHSDLNLIVLGNFDAIATATVNPNFQKTGTWFNVLTGQQLNVVNTTATITLQPGELLIYADRAITFPNSLTNPTSTETSIVYPTFTKGKVFVSTSSAVKNVKVYNLQGSMIETVDNSSEIDITNKPVGLYVMEVNTSNGKSIHKIVKE